jgi:hypothetical protein
MKWHFPTALVLVFVSCAAYADSYCVRKAGSSLYEGPSETSKVILKAPIYTPLLGTGIQKNKMIEVTDVDSKKYWVSKKSVSTKISCVVVRVKKSKLRSGPGTDFAMTKNKVASKYAAFVDLGGEDGWTQVRDQSGEKAWVDMDNVWKPMSKMRISFDGD